MRTVVVTDGKYRASIAVVRTLGRAGMHVVVTQTRGDTKYEPPVFASRYTAEKRWIEGSVNDPEYTGRLSGLLKEYDKPVLLCVGAATLNTVAQQRDEFSELASFLIADSHSLDELNDKRTVHNRCIELGIPVPCDYDGTPEDYPVIVKPRCGEKAGLKAQERYAVANTPAQYEAALAAMKIYDPAPIVQQRVSGDGSGASLLLDREHRLIAAICHRRIREYPLMGGPSTCCESVYDEQKIEQAYRLLRSFDFTGMAMVEFKGDYVLEVNPRIWGSFPMTECAKSPFTLRYAQAAAGEQVEYSPCDYKTGIRMRFMLNDGAAALSALSHGKFATFFQSVADVFRAKEALSDSDDPAPLRRYLRVSLRR